MHVENKKEIIICPYCGGYERTRCIERRGPEKNLIEKPCKQCNGTGKLWKITRVKLEAISEPDKLYKQL